MLRALLVVGLLVVPALELWVAAQVTREAGLAATLLALVLTSLAGAVVVRTEGLRAAWQVREALAEGREPSAELLRGALGVTGAVLLALPGFVTDGVGILLLLPPTRALAAAAVRAAGRRAVGRPARAGRGRTARSQVRVTRVERHRLPPPHDGGDRSDGRDEPPDGAGAPPDDEPDDPPGDDAPREG